MIGRALAGVLLALASTLAPPAGAEHLPRWELGAGLFLGYLPDYPGSDQARLQGLPYPYVIYRGERVLVDADGVRGALLDQPRLRLELSASGSLAVRSQDNRARREMPDLDYLFELGPSLHWRFDRPPGAAGRWRLELPLRAVFATDLAAIRHTGWIFQPGLSYGRRLDWGGVRPSRLRLTAGPVFADRRFHDYLYGVDARFALADRPAYQAGAGFSGQRLLVSLGHDLSPDLLLGAFVRYDRLAGSVIEDSPLLRREDSFSAGLALTWTLRRSTERVRHDPEDDRIPGSVD